MKEQQIHAGLMMWLKKQGLYYIHSTFGKKATMTKDAPDFIILHANRVLLLEVKTETGKLTAGQDKKFAEIRQKSGMVVQISRSVEESVNIVREWMGCCPDTPSQEKRAGGIPSTQEEAVELMNRQADASIPSPPIREPSQDQLWIGNLYGTDYVFRGEYSAGSTAAMLRRATPEDARNYPRR